MKKGFEITTRFQAIFNEQSFQLYLKGYTEKVLNSRTFEGTLKNQFLAAFETAIKDNLWVYQQPEFSVSITGYFTRSKDEVQFTLKYIWNPENISLKLNSLVASMDDVTKEYNIINHPSHDLPFVSKVYYELLKLSKAEVLRTAINSTESKQKQKSVKR